jgi:hypothetical protein
VIVLFFCPRDSVLTRLVTFFAMSLAIRNGTPDLEVVLAILSRSNFSFLPLDLRTVISAGFLLRVDFLAVRRFVRF